MIANATSQPAPSAVPVVIAHRGASGYLPEHTLEAKAMAHAMGADFLEQDVVLTRDDVPIVIHDIELETTSDVADRFPGRSRPDGHYYALDFTLAEIKQLQAHERVDPATGRVVFPNRFPLGKASFQIPTLEEELQLIQGLNRSTGRVAGIYPEIKEPHWHRAQGHDISRGVLPILERYGYASPSAPCWVQCFDWEELKRIRTELGWLGRLLLLLESGAQDAECTPEWLTEVAKTVEGIGPELNSIVIGRSAEEREITSLVANAHSANLQVHAYTYRRDDLPGFARSPEDGLAALFNEAHLDGLFTDFPDVAARWLRRNPAR